MAIVLTDVWMVCLVVFVVAFIVAVVLFSDFMFVVLWVLRMRKSMPMNLSGRVNDVYKFFLLFLLFVVLQTLIMFVSFSSECVLFFVVVIVGCFLH